MQPTVGPGSRPGRLASSAIEDWRDLEDRRPHEASNFAPAMRHRQWRLRFTGWSSPAGAQLHKETGVRLGVEPGRPQALGACMLALSADEGDAASGQGGW